MVDLENIKISIDSSKIRYNEGVTSKGNHVVTCILPYRIKSKTNYSNTLWAGMGFHKDFSDISGGKVLYAIGKAVLYQSYDEIDDTWDAELGRKIAYTKAEINAYRHTMKRIYRLNKEITEALNKTSMRFLDKASNVISHDEEYLTKICGKSFN